MKIKEHNLGNYIVPQETKNGVCLEIGANVGSFTTKWANHFEKIYFYEPLSECFNIVQNKTKQFKNVYGYRLAGYKESGIEKKMILHKSEFSGSSGLESDTLNEDWVETIETVTTISLVDMIDKMNVKTIDYCKSDCETSEYHIFMNQDLSLIKYLGIEIHAQMGKERWNELISYIENTHNLISGNRIWSSTRNSEFLFKLKD